MKTTIFISIKIFLVMTVLTGIIYPLILFVIGQTIFPENANGSLITKNGKIIGSELIGQNFKSDIYFHSRPSAINYNPLPSGGSNLSVTSTELKLRTKQNIADFDSVNQINGLQKIPKEMIYASGSGLDPHISAEAAILQVNRICKARNLTIEENKEIRSMIDQSVEGRGLGFLGEPRINVLKLNMILDQKFPIK